MNSTQKTAAQFWDDATPRLVRKLYIAAGLPFSEACLFSAIAFAGLPLALKVAIYECDEWRNQVCDPEQLNDACERLNK